MSEAGEMVDCPICSQNHFGSGLHCLLCTKTGEVPALLDALWRLSSAEAHRRVLNRLVEARMAPPVLLSSDQILALLGEPG